MVIALDLDGVLCDLGPCVAARIADRFGVATHPSTWRTYDLRLLQLGVPERSFNAFLDEVHHTPVGTKAAVARRVGAVAAIEDNPVEADLLGAVCESWLLDRPYNRDHELQRARRLDSWDDAVGRLCQLRLFA